MIVKCENILDKEEYGDYQTPLNFTASICSMLKKKYKLRPTVVIEPTCGTGNFIKSAFFQFSNVSAIYGIEINERYIEQFKRTTNVPSKITLFHDDIFQFNFKDIKNTLANNDDILILGNPPWVTNTQLSLMQSHNLPPKSNFKKHDGLSAATGKSNFDIAEYIILRMLEEFSQYKCTIAMLCKTVVAKNIIRDIRQYNNLKISFADMYLFNAKEVFNVNCDAALLVIQLGELNTTVCDVYDYYSFEKIRQFGWVNGLFLADISKNASLVDIDGKCLFQWRQGVKHDCSKVMELELLDDGSFMNAMKEIVYLSLGQYVYPLVKSSHIKQTEITKAKKYVIVTQKKLKEETESIRYKDKELWNYLTKYEDLLNQRRSVIYRKSPKFSMFGIGDYTFAKYKIGISGFYKEPIFSLIYGEHPFMLDDTCYFVGFDNLIDAIITTALLNSSICKNFLKSIAFLEAKRPYTKDILQRIDLLKLVKVVYLKDIQKFASGMLGGYKITTDQYSNYQLQLKNSDIS